MNDHEQPRWPGEDPGDSYGQWPSADEPAPQWPGADEPPRGGNAPQWPSADPPRGQQPPRPPQSGAHPDGRHAPRQGPPPQPPRGGPPPGRPQGPPPGAGQRPPQRPGPPQGGQGPPQGGQGPPWARQGQPPQGPQGAGRGGHRPPPPEQPTGYVPQVPEPESDSGEYEPGLLTHDSAYADAGGYGDYGYGDYDDYDDRWDDDPDDGDPDDAAAAHNESGRKRAKAALTPKQRKRRRWRIVRRTLYALVGIFFVLPALAFTITYFIVDVPTPQEVAADQGQVVTYYYANGDVMGKVAPTKTGNRVILQPHQIPEVVKHAVYAAEDASFETNPGFDISGIARAAWSQLTGGGGGGSTISQQYVKQATGYDDHTYARKFVEVVKSFKMNNEQSKTEIITAYLNTVYFGRGAYGIQTAAQAYFGKDVGQLTAAEAAVLGGMIQQPSRYDDTEYMKYRWNYVMDQMVVNNWLAPQKRKAAQFPEMIPTSEIGNKSFTGPMVHVQQRVKAELKAKGYPEKKLQSGGYKVYTTIDPRAQKLAKQAVESVMKGQPHKLREAFVAVDPSNGAVRAYYGGPRNKEGGFADAANTLRNPGSSFKPFDLVALLKEGKGLGTTYNGTSPQKIGGAVRHNAGPNSTCSATCTVATGMEVSANTLFFNMVINDLSVQQVIDAAHSAGIPLKWNGEKTMAKGDYNIAIGGGGTRVSPTMMAEAYATFASGGVRHNAHFVSKLVDSEGDVVYKTNTDGKPAFADTRKKSQQIAGNVTRSLKPVLPHSDLSCAPGYHCAGKTGTHETKGSRTQNSQAWMVGYTPTISAAAWVGTFGGPTVPIVDAAGRPIYGADLPGSIWEKFMQSYLPGTPKKRFPDVELIGKPVQQYNPVNRNPNTGARQEDTEENRQDDSTTTTTTTTTSQDQGSTETNTGEPTQPDEPTGTENPGPGDGGNGEGDNGLFKPQPPGQPPENQAG